MQLNRKVIQLEQKYKITGMHALKIQYDSEIRKLTDETEKAVREKSGLVDVIHKHNQLVLDVFNQLVSKINIPKGMEIVLSGSFAKVTNLLDSDFDITFIYPDSKRSVCYRLEKQLNTAFKYVLGDSEIFHIHSPITQPAGQESYLKIKIDSIGEPYFIPRYFLKVRSNLQSKLWNILNTSKEAWFDYFEFGNNTERIKKFSELIKSDFLSIDFGEMNEMSIIVA